MRRHSFRQLAKRNPESGQAILFTLLGLGIFLIGAMAFAVDMSNLWFNRQSAQTAADAACTAGAMDLLVDATNGATTQGGFTAGTAFDCNAAKSSGYAPCQYATLNGFNSSIASSSTSLGNNVSVSFPSSVAGVVTPPSAIAPTAFMKVTVTDNVPTFFAGMLKGMTQQSVGAIAICGIAESAAPIPILVLDPQNPSKKASALSVQGTPTIAIFGGPSRSIEVNSNDPAAVNAGGNGLIDLSQGGPGGTGSDIGIFGGPTTAPGSKNFLPGTTGHWIAPASPIMDPFAQVCYPGQSSNCTTTINGYSVPAVPSAPSGVTGSLGTVCTATKVVNGNCNVLYTENGCPDAGGCVLYEPGAYAGGIAIGPGGGVTAIFDPGLYYVTGGLALNSLSAVRPGTGVGDGSGGVTFYFSGTGTVSVAANSGSRTLDPFNTLKGPGVASGNSVTPYAGGHSYSMGVQCTSTSAVPNNLLGTGTPSPGININGNILLGPCTGYYGDPLGTSEPASIGEQRWFLFFQDRSAQGVQPQWGGGGQFLLAGSMYFHSCNASGTGVGCGSAPTYYDEAFSLSGNSGAGTYVLGEIVTDNLSLGGTSGINMDLNPTSAFNILKASLYQ